MKRQSAPAPDEPLQPTPQGSEGLVERLRVSVREIGQTNGRGMHGGDLELMDAAADRIEALEGERVRDREVIARIIDPECMRLAGWLDEPNVTRRRTALAKADAILSALAVGGISSVAESGGTVPTDPKSDNHNHSEGGRS